VSSDANPKQPPPFPAELVFFGSEAQACSYLEGQDSVSVFADPDADLHNDTYSALAEVGFRRSGSHVYRPHCSECQACIPVRLPVALFTPNRKQRRTRNSPLPITVHITTPIFREEQFALYQRYLATRHAGGDMDDPSPEKYMAFLSCTWSHTEFVEFRHQGQLVAVAVQDVLSRGLSSVYCFFEPNFGALSLGHYALLWQINEAQRRELPWLFLGYWIQDCQKMVYKQEYRPIELFQNGRWQRFARHQTLLPPTANPQ
jgi:leucyl-tRNA---protein transferase